MEIKDSKPVSMLEVKEELAEREKEGELGYEQAQALEHSQALCTMTVAKFEKLKAKLSEYESLNDEMAIKILEVIPQDPSTLKAILLKDRIELEDSTVEEIVKLMK
jgi:DNA-directed RNA polymerase subunit F